MFNLKKISNKKKFNLSFLKKAQTRIPSLEEYAGKMPDSNNYPSDEEWLEDYQPYRKRVDEWRNIINRNYSLGNISIEEAKKLGHQYTSGLEKLVDLPEFLYHVTTAKTKVLQEGLKTKTEMNMTAAPGLGGGDPEQICLTSNIQYARAIENTLFEGLLVAQNKFSIEEMIDNAEQGKGTRQPYAEKMIQGFESHYGPLKYILNDQKYETTIMGEKVEDLENMGYSIPEEAYTWEGGDGLKRTSAYLRPLTQEEKDRYRNGMYRYFALYRQEAGGPEYAWFGFNSEEALSKIDPNEICILKFKSKPGAKGEFVSHAESEYRIYDGKAIELVEIIV